MKAGVPFGKVARALGTNEQVVEQVYGHHLPEHLRGVVEIVSRGGRAEGTGGVRGTGLRTFFGDGGPTGPREARFVFPLCQRSTAWERQSFHGEGQEFETLTARRRSGAGLRRR